MIKLLSMACDIVMAPQLFLNICFTFIVRILGPTCRLSDGIGLFPLLIMQATGSPPHKGQTKVKTQHSTPSSTVYTNPE